MKITRSGPPITHDNRLWRVPLSGPPSATWQKSFQSVVDTPGRVSVSRVHFEPEALTFRSDDADVPAWIASIDGWIAHANEVDMDVAEEARRKAARAQLETDERRRQATQSTEKFKNL